MKLKASITFVLIALSVVFIAQNIEVVEVHFLIWQLNISRAMLIIFLLLIGFVIGWLLHGYATHKKHGKD